MYHRGHSGTLGGCPDLQGWMETRRQAVETGSRDTKKTQLRAEMGLSESISFPQRGSGFNPWHSHPNTKLKGNLGLVEMKRNGKTGVE